jgi:hypothetical protein
VKKTVIHAGWRTDAYFIVARANFEAPLASVPAHKGRYNFAPENTVTLNVTRQSWYGVATSGFNIIVFPANPAGRVSLPGCPSGPGKISANGVV